MSVNTNPDRHNQFHGYQAHDRAPEALARPHIRQRASEIDARIKEDPRVCHVPRSPTIGMRVENKIARISWRAVVYFHRFGYLPKSGFAAPDCGTKGCINPHHQRPSNMAPADFIRTCEPVRVIDLTGQGVEA